VHGRHEQILCRGRSLATPCGSYSGERVILPQSLGHSSNRGATGYGAALENVDDAIVEGNGFFDNHVGLQIVQSPSNPQARNVIRGNRFADDGTAVAAESTITHTTIAGNDFAGNLEQVRIDGGASLGGVTWNEHGRGNHWSDYAGYDRDGDGIGDVPYAPVARTKRLGRRESRR
jgi:nitrous oxidase accessory protein